MCVSFYPIHQEGLHRAIAVCNVLLGMDHLFRGLESKPKGSSLDPIYSILPLELSLYRPLQEGCEAVPHRATVYSQLVESELLWSWGQLQPVMVEGARLAPPPAVTQCAGAHSVCDIQLSQVSPEQFTPLGPLCTMFR